MSFVLNQQHIKSRIDVIWSKVQHLDAFTASLIAQLLKNPPAMQETLVQLLGQEDLLGKG